MNLLKKWQQRKERKQKEQQEKMERNRIWNRRNHARIHFLYDRQKLNIKCEMCGQPECDEITGVDNEQGWHYKCLDNYYDNI